MSTEGTPEALLPLAEQVLALVADSREYNVVDGKRRIYLTDDDLRRIELMALTVQEQVMLYRLYGGTDAPAPQAQDQR